MPQSKTPKNYEKLIGRRAIVRNKHLENAFLILVDAHILFDYEVVMLTKNHRDKQDRALLYSEELLGGHTRNLISNELYRGVYTKIAGDLPYDHGYVWAKYHEIAIEGHNRDYKKIKIERLMALKEKFTEEVSKGEEKLRKINKELDLLNGKKEIIGPAIRKLDIED